MSAMTTGSKCLTGSRNQSYGADQSRSSNGYAPRLDTAVISDYENTSVDEVNYKQQESRGLVPITERPSRADTYGSTFDQKQGGKLSSTRQLFPRVHSRRWLNLMLFCLYSFSNSFQWIHLNIIANTLGSYYNQSLSSDTYQRNTTIDWLSMVYMLAYIPLILPASWILDKKGLRLCCICGSLLNAAGSWLKCACVSPDRFALLMFAQTMCAMAQVWVLGIPAKLAAVWFGPNEVSTATSLGVFGNQVGIAIGFLVPPTIVADSNNLDVVGASLSTMYYGTAGLTTLVFILNFLFFCDKPPQPPSRAQDMAVHAATSHNYLQALVQLLTNKGFVLLMIAYGINTGSFYALSTLLNAIVLSYFPGQGETTGRIGLTIVLMGVLGSILAGLWLDRTKSFKRTTIAIYFCSLAGTMAFTLTLGLNIVWIVFVTAGSLGFFMTGYLPVGYEFAAELTFPVSEGTSSGLLNASAQVFGITLTLGMRAMLESVSVLGANITVCACLLLGNIVTALIRPDYRRQQAGQAEVQVFTQEHCNLIRDAATYSNHSMDLNKDNIHKHLLTADSSVVE